MTTIDITLKDGTPAKATKFDQKDYQKMIDLLKQIKESNAFLNQMGGRKINIPDVISEGMYCYNFNAVRTNGSAGSFDCVDLDTKDGVQIKSASIENDCTSFGPTSTWDKLIFIDYSKFINNQSNEIYFYLIKVNIHSLVLNASRGETFADQQKQGRRPRFTIKTLINEHKIPILKKIKI
jgi:hypothetical protein